MPKTDERDLILCAAIKLATFFAECFIHLLFRWRDGETGCDLIPHSEACESLQCEPRTLTRYRNEGRIGGTRKGKFWYYRQADVEQLMRERRKE